jgi:hypothetical protein
MTPNLQIVRNFIATLPEWDFVHRVGVTNCRKIAGSSSYSQHSWSNALDIHFTASVGTPATGAALAAGTSMKQKILNKFEPHINEMLWQVSGHWEHIHVSTWPKGWLTPPCADGAQRIKYENGTVVAGPFPLTINEQGDDEVQSLRNQVAEAIQKGWLGWPDEGTFWLNLCDDPTNTQWRTDFEPMWNTRKAQEWALINAPNTGIVDQTARNAAAAVLNALEALKTKLRSV